MSDTHTPDPIDIPVDPITGPADIIPLRKPRPMPKPAQQPDPLRGPLGDTTAEPYENEG